MEKTRSVVVSLLIGGDDVKEEVTRIGASFRCFLRATGRLMPMPPHTRLFSDDPIEEKDNKRLPIVPAPLEIEPNAVNELAPTYRQISKYASTYSIAAAA